MLRVSSYFRYFSESIVPDILAWPLFDPPPRLHYSIRARIQRVNQTPLICSTSSTVMSPKRLISRLAGVSSLLPSVYSEAWVKGNAKSIPRTFSSLRDAEHGKRAG
ncbi:hypothetical protein TNCV_3775861 [Trichonephila clavipes]|nr:hypothetical protein TNCV_3775861 [Trichonephila clavipes]